MGEVDEPAPEQEFWVYAAPRTNDRTGQRVDAWVDPGGAVLHYQPYPRLRR